MGTFFFGPGIKSWGAHPFREQGLCILPESSGRSISFLVEFRLDRIYSFKGSFGIHRSSLVLTTGFSQFSDNQTKKPALMAGLFSSRGRSRAAIFGRIFLSIIIKRSNNPQSIQGQKLYREGKVIVQYSVIGR